MTTLLLGDCLELMKGMADKSVDCFICDLPYGQLANRVEKILAPSIYNHGPGKIIACPWDVKLDLAEFWKQVKRLAKNDHTPVLMFCNTKFGYDLIKSNESWFRYDLVWDKGRGVSFLLANKMPMKSHEMIYVFSKKGTFYKRINIEGEFKEIKRNRDKNGVSRVYSGVISKDSKDTSAVERCPLSIIPIGGKSAGGHPTEKPMELYEWLLRRYVPENGTVLDPTAGSFNSILMAKRLGFKGIGIEKDNGFFWKGVKKLSADPNPLPSAVPEVISHVP